MITLHTITTSTVIVRRQIASMYVFHTSFRNMQFTIAVRGRKIKYLLSAQYTDKSGSVMFNKSELRSFDAQIRMPECPLSHKRYFK